MTTKSVTSKLLVQLIDGVTGPAAKAGAALKVLQRTANFVGAPFGAATSAVAGRVKALGQSAQQLSTAMAPATLAGGYGFFRAYEYEKALNTMEALGELTKAQRDETDKFFRDISDKSPRSMKELAQVTNELLRGGLALDAAKGALKSTMDLSIFGDIEPKAASEIAINALNQFRMPMKTVGEAQASMRKVADVIAYAANKSATDVRLMGETFKYAGPLATSLGVSMEGLAAGAMLMANSGIKGAEAGVAFRSMLGKMIKPTKDGLATLAQYNIKLADFVQKGQDVTARGLVAALETHGIDAGPLTGQFEKALADPALKAAPQRMVVELTKIISDGLGSSAIVDKDKLAEHLNDALNVAGSRIDYMGFVKELTDKAGPNLAGAFFRFFDMRQAGRLITLAAGDLAAALKGIMGSAGYAAKGAETMLGGIVGAVNRITNALDQLFTKLAQSGFFDDLANGLTRVTAAIKSMSEFDKNLLRFATYGALALASAGAISATISAIGAAAALAANPITWLIAGLGALAYFHWDEVKAAATEFAGGFSTGFWAKINVPPETLQSWENLKSALKDIGLDVDLVTWRSVGEALGGAVATGVNALATAFRHVANTITAAIRLAQRLKETLSNFSFDGFKRGLGLGGAPEPAQTPPGRAVGGPVGAGHPYIVGERGPELFVPGRSGSIVPNNRLGAGGGVTISPTFNFSIGGNADATDIEARVTRALERYVDSAIRGAYGDVGMRWA